ncbi:putative laccase-9 [Solanum tuberosum]|uniref:putative laccase-9 n=1 Tax=Solanum tuberosum TaxID=4113 RepID=UPI00073A0957|nr:PREDICTED: putative laccase-9 [Solanum tuberosum]
MAFQKQAMKANTSLIEETSFDRLCQSKKILTINGRFPGPTIYARAGETLALDVENRGKDNVTIFCCKREGKHLKSDQVNWLIEPGFKLRKNITIFDKEGTLWWHAMNIWQSATVHGAFIVHSKPGTTRDIPIILGEWWKRDVKEVVLDYIDSGSGVNSDAFTVNGQPGDFYPCSNNGTFRIVVNTGKTYLLRVVNAAMSKTLFFGIARHNLTVVAMDGSPITKPFSTDYVELSIQQSVDCIFEANQQPDYYYMADRAATRESLTFKDASYANINNIFLSVQFSYIGEFEYVDDHRSGKIVVELNGRLHKCGVISPRFDVGD